MSLGGKNIENIFFYGFQHRPPRRLGRLWAPPGRPRNTPRDPQVCPRLHKNAPRWPRAQDGPKTPQETPKTAQDGTLGPGTLPGPSWELFGGPQASGASKEHAFGRNACQGDSAPSPREPGGATYPKVSSGSWPKGPCLALSPVPWHMYTRTSLVHQGHLLAWQQRISSDTTGPPSCHQFVGRGVSCYDFLQHNFVSKQQFLRRP